MLKLKGEPNPLVKATPQGEDGRVVLKAVDADIHSRLNTTPRVESPDEKANIGYWTDPSAWLSSSFSSTNRARSMWLLKTASTADNSQLSVEIGNEHSKCDVPNTGDHREYKETPGPATSLCRSRACMKSTCGRAEGWQAVNLRSIQLVPVK